MRLALVAILAACSPASSSPKAPTMTSTHGYAPVNGLQLYYEIHGTGEPLIVLHGAFGSVEELDAVPGVGPATLDELRDLVDL